MLTGSPTDLWTVRASDAKSRVAIFGRLARHATIEQARAEFQTLAEFTREELVRTSKDPQWKHMKFFVEFAGNGNNRVRDGYGKPLTIIMSIAGVLLAIACINLAGMLLARAAGRQREMSIRLGLGASRVRLIRQVMTESLLLSAIGAVLAVGVAFGAIRVLSAIIASGRPHERVVLDLTPDLDSLLFTLIVSIATGLLFGLAPAFAGTKPARRTRRLSDGLVAAQIAAAVVLLTAAALATGYLSDLRNSNLGFNRHNVLLFQVDGSKGFDKVRAVELLRRFEAIPGVTAASISGMSPIQGAGASRMVNADGFVERPEDRRYSSLNWVTPRYFEALGIPLLEGRDFRFDDEGKAPYAIISRAMAQHYFRGRNAIGGVLQFDGRTTRYEVIGVVGDSKYLDLQTAPPRTMYMNTLQTPNPVSQYVVRTAVAPESIVNEARRIAAEVAPGARVDRVTTLAEQVDSSIVRERLVAQLANLFGALGALIAAIGLYGLLAYNVARRTSEIGLRMALGATQGDVLRLILKHALVVTLVGVAIGAGVASQAPGLPASVATPAVIGAGAMLAIALVAAYVPARRAARIEPVRALRCE
jgi:predicted permease